MSDIPQYPGVPVSSPNPDTHRQQLARTLNGVLAGKLNVRVDLTLTASATSTVLEDARLSPFCVATLDPVTATAAAELAAGTVYALAGDRLTGRWTFTHANASTADRTFRLAILG